MTSHEVITAEVVYLGREGHYTALPSFVYVQSFHKKKCKSKMKKKKKNPTRVSECGAYITGTPAESGGEWGMG